MKKILPKLTSSFSIFHSPFSIFHLSKLPQLFITSFASFSLTVLILTIQVSYFPKKTTCAQEPNSQVLGQKTLLARLYLKDTGQMGLYGHGSCGAGHTDNGNDTCTATFDNPTVDGTVSSLFSKSTDDTTIHVGSVGNGEITIYRGFVEWNISSISAGSTINNTVFKYHGSTHNGDHLIAEVLGARPSTATGQELFNEIGEGTVYADPDGFPVASSNQQADLGSSADSDLQSQISSGWFGIGIQEDPYESDALIYSEEYGSANPKPTLEVTYVPSPAGSSNINVIGFDSDGDGTPEMIIDSTGHVGIGTTNTASGRINFKPGESQAQDSKTQTSDADFNAGTTSNTTVSSNSVSFSLAVTGNGALVTAFDGDGILRVTGTTGAAAIEVDSDYIYLLGYTGSYPSYVALVEKRNKTSGALVNAFDSDGILEIDMGGIGQLYDLKIDSNYIYLGGKYDSSADNNGKIYLEKRNKTTGALVTAFDGDGKVIEDVHSTLDDIVYAIEIDSSAIYLCGGDRHPSTNFGRTRYEKRDIDTGALVTAFSSNGIITSAPDAATNYCRDIKVDSGSIYTINQQGGVGDGKWRLEKRNKTSGAYVTAFSSDGWLNINPGGLLDGPCCLDIDSAAVYATGYYNEGYVDSTAHRTTWIEKRNITSGALDTSFSGDGIVKRDFCGNMCTPNDIAVDENTNRLYYTIYDRCTGGGQWRIEKRNSSSAALDASFSGDGIITENPSAGIDSASKLTVYHPYLYLFGTDYIDSTYRWRIEKRTTDDAYNTSGTFTSSAINTGQSSSDYTTLGFNLTEPSNTDVKFQLRSASTEGGLSSATWYGPTGTGDYYSTSGTTINSTNDNNQWIQYRATCTSSDDYVTPSLDDITINFNYTQYSDSLYVDPAGNVGIGTTNPGSKLDVSGDTRFGCRSGFWSIADGRLCMESTLRGPHNAHGAIGACKSVAPGSRVCTHIDHMRACGAGYNGYAGSTTGWYGDHGLAVGGNWDDEFGAWNRDWCDTNNDGPALSATSTTLYYRCCY